MTDTELKELAKDIYAGRVFTDRHIPEHDAHLLPNVFAIIWLMDKDSLKGMVKDCGLIFEYMDKAAPRGINGYPSFFSLWYLTRSDADKVSGYVKQIADAMDAI